MNDSTAPKPRSFGQPHAHPALDARTDHPDMQAMFGRPSPAAVQAVEQALQTRRSIRRFLPDPVPKDLILRVLDLAARAPSGTNTQPWTVHVLQGQVLTGLRDKLCATFDDPALMAQLHEPYAYYPTEWVSPYLERRRKVGFDLYGLLGIVKGDRQAMHRQHRRNFEFFDAPVGMMFTIDRIMGQGSWLDYGMFLQNLMVAARGLGLHTCAQAAFNPFHQIILDHLAVSGDAQTLVCGLSMGYADPQAPENRLRSERESVDQFVTFHGEASHPGT